MDQIATLKEELKVKNEIIFELIQATTAKARNQDAILDSKAFDPEKRQKSSSSLESPESRRDIVVTQDNNEANNLWQQPKKFSRASRATDNTPVKTSNRYESLRENEWIKDDGDNAHTPQSTPHTDRMIKKKKRSSKRTVTIVGDSMLKDVKQWDIQKFIPDHKVYVKSFPGATTEDLEDYIKPSLKHEPDVIVIHIGTNDLRSNTSSGEIAERIFNLASSVKNECNEVAISSIINRRDNLNIKATDVNNLLVNFCQKHNFGFLDNGNIEMEHLQGGGKWGGLHLNNYGNDIFKGNFIDFINL